MRRKCKKKKLNTIISDDLTNKKYQELYVCLNRNVLER